MPLLPIALPDAELAIDRDWLPRAEAAALFADLLARLPWEVHRIRMFGRMVDSPRLSCWIGDAGAVYRYSGARFAPQPWVPALQAMRGRLQRTLDTPFNSVLANLYRDGADAMGWHRDDEKELGDTPCIASVSLGATRRFVLRHVGDPARRVSLELEAGSLLVMAGATQRNYRHALPRTARPVGARINLTFRHVVAR